MLIGEPSGVRGFQTAGSEGRRERLETATKSEVPAGRVA
jgi:hypothetical protein